MICAFRLNIIFLKTKTSALFHFCRLVIPSCWVTEWNNNLKKRITRILSAAFLANELVFCSLSPTQCLRFICQLGN